MSAYPSPGKKFFLSTKPLLIIFGVLLFIAGLILILVGLIPWPSSSTKLQQTTATTELKEMRAITFTFYERNASPITFRLLADNQTVDTILTDVKKNPNSNSLFILEKPGKLDSIIIRRYVNEKKSVLINGKTYQYFGITERQKRLRY